MGNICGRNLNMTDAAYSLDRESGAAAGQVNQLRRHLRTLETSMELSPSQRSFVSRHRQTYQTLAVKRERQKSNIEPDPTLTEAERNFLGNKGRFNIMAALHKLELDTRDVVGGLTTFESQLVHFAGGALSDSTTHCCNEMEKLARRWECIGKELQRAADLDNAEVIENPGGARRIGGMSF